MSDSNVQLLPSTQGVVNITGTPVRGAGSTRSVGSLYTVVMTANNLQGRVYIEGSIASSPTVDDWFVIVMPNIDTPYVEFPYAEGNTVGGVTTAGFTFKGNFTWIRARLDRDYLGIYELSPLQLAAFGHLDQIMLNVGGWSAATALSTDTTSGSILSGVESVKGNNLGNGKRVFANTVGQSNVLMNFRTLLGGPGINLSSNASTITIEARAGEDGVNAFTDLIDAPTTISANAVVYGGTDNALHFTPAANSVANATLGFSNGEFVWKDLHQEIRDVAGWDLLVQENGANVANSAKIINFTGSVNVSETSGTTTVEIGNVGSRYEWIEMQYFNSSGILDVDTAVLNKTNGITATITDDVACTVEFDFSGRPFPPTSITILGQQTATGTFSYQNVHAAKGVAIDAADTDELLAAFAGPIKMTLTMSETNSSVSGPGQRAKFVVLFGF